MVLSPANMKLSLQICFLSLCVAAVYAKYKTTDFSDKERWDATLQGVAHAEEYIQNMEKEAKAQGTSTTRSAAQKLKNFLRRASPISIAMGKARLRMEQAVKHAERILLEKKRLQTAKIASREELAEVIAQELYHKPGSILDKKELAHIYQSSGCEEIRHEPICSTIPFYHSIRTISGVCNNVIHPTQGASFTPFQRLIQGQYANGIDSLFNQADDPNLGPFSPPSPSARLVSDIAITDRQDNDSLLTHLIMQWGQFTDHDLDLAVEFSDVTCDLENCGATDICAPVRVPRDDEQFGEGTTNNGACHAFQRTVPACVENPTDFNAREQVNELTHYIDGSMIYGSTNARASFLRENVGGRLKVSPGDNLPLQPPCAPVENPLGEIREVEDCSCPNNFTECFVAGDIRALEHVSLTVMHTIWVREHNRVAAALSVINPQWEDERLYVEARKIVIAQIQQITFSQYLPALFGQQNFDTFIGSTYPVTGYDDRVDASIPNSFATAAFRFGHSQIQPFFARLGPDGQSVAGGPLSLADSFFNSTEFDNSGVTPIVRGWITQPARAMDEFLNSVITSQLFEGMDNREVGLDLATLNIQRGRDHGLPRYGTWKSFCMSAFGIESSFRNELTAIRLRKLYGTDENIDLFVAALAEDPLPGSVLGATLTCIFALTFSRLRVGDRFWYENPEDDIVFTPPQLAQIRQTSFSRLLCDNSDITRIQPNPFFQDVSNIETESCDPITGAITGINFEPWREVDFCFYRATARTGIPSNTLFSFFNRPTGSGTNDISRFQFSISGSDGTVTRCVPFICPGPDPNLESDNRDLIATVANTNRRAACRVQQNPGSQSSFAVTITTLDIATNAGLFESEAACEAGSVTVIDYVCDGAAEAARSQNEEIASTAELERELAKALQTTEREMGRELTPTFLEHESGVPDEDIYGLTDLFNSSDFPPLPGAKKTAKIAAKRTHTTGKFVKTEEENDKLIDLLQATIEELQHEGK